MKNFFLCPLLILLLIYGQKSESTTVHDFETWTSLTVIGNFDKESYSFHRFKYWFDSHGRFGENSSRVSQALLRPGLGYSLTKNTSLWLGYAWVDTSIPLTTVPHKSNRIWQQLLWVKKTNQLTFTSRTRQEEIFSKRNDRVAYRTRQLLKLVAPFNSTFSFVSSDEIFGHLNNYVGHHGKGFDQNRFFIGVGYNIYPKITTEIGYMNLFLRRLNSANFRANILSINFYLNF